MINNEHIQQFLEELEQIRAGGLFKSERIVQGAQGIEIMVQGRSVINFCANNYLALANDPLIVRAAHEGLDRWGYGLSSVRFICGTQQIHKDLEAAITDYLDVEDTVLFSSCFDANAGLFEVITNEQDTIISDRLNHASIIDGIRLSKANRLVYEHLNVDDLEHQLVAAKSSRRKVVVTDGVFSMDGDIAPLDKITKVTEKHNALLVVDDSHATGFVGPEGRGTPSHFDLQHKVDIITGTLGKALGGASGGFIAGRRQIVDLLRQRARPYLFSNSLPPFIASASLAVIKHLRSDHTARQKLWENTAYFRQGISRIGLSVHHGIHPIIPVMLHDATAAQQLAARLLELGVYVISFSYPVVPKGQARIRVQISSGHERRHLDAALEAFQQAAQELQITK